ncbi:MAG TPA: CHAD domain-containing protein, partial [Albitalea sp.]|nr:CHAD domain-containing protein [Albitalea sp.]
LLPLYRTDIRRRTRVLPVRADGQPSARVELAFDRGRIEAGTRGIDVSELEIELVGGPPRAVIETARRWVARHGLWLDGRSKAERGDLLARGEAMAAPRKQQAVQLAREMSVAQGLRCVLLSCLDQVSVNASQVASGHYEAEHVHQLRVGLRRLRTALRLFDVEASHADLADAATALFRQLGPARDQAAVMQPMQRELHEAMTAAGLRFDAPDLPAPSDEAEPAALVRAFPAQQLLLALYAHTQAEPAPAIDGEPPLRELLAQRLNRWQRQVAADAARFAELDDAARHTLRKRAKHLRYGAEFAASLFPQRRVRRLLKSLRALQDRLGVFIDVLMALAAYRERSDSDAHALFAVGWLAARREALLRESLPDVTAFAKAKRFWKRAVG